MPTLIQEFFLAVAMLSIIPLFGAAFGYFTFRRLKENEGAFALFSSYLMILLGAFLLLVSVLKSKIAPGVELDGGKGFLVGLALVWLTMRLYHRLATHSDHYPASNGSFGFALTLFFMLMAHEMLEGISVAEMFFEMSGGSVPVFTSLTSLLVLALHEFPEGMMLVMPFFLAGENKKGLYAVAVNITTFAGSAIFAYFVLLRHIEPSPHQAAFLTGIPAGGIFFLGLHEAKNALRYGIRKASRTSKMALGTVSALITGIIAFVLVHTSENIEAKTEVRISGYEQAANGDMIPVIYADPCAHDADLHDCLD